jgi:hypothetical protein
VGQYAMGQSGTGVLSISTHHRPLSYVWIRCQLRFHLQFHPSTILVRSLILSSHEYSHRFEGLGES